MEFEQATQAAREIDSLVDTVIEYRNFWVFFKKGRRAQDSEICIDRTTGNRVSYAELVVENRVEETGKLKDL